MSAFLLFYFDQFPFVKALTAAHLFYDAGVLLFMSRRIFYMIKKFLIASCKMKMEKKRFNPFVFIRGVSLFEVGSKLNFVVLSTKRQNKQQ
jgi:hypothetical protein